MKTPKKNFLKMPNFLGGAEALKKFIKKNLKYPALAVEHKIEGSVLLSFKVNDNGEVSDAKVEKGLGFGCDEEALRLINLLVFEKVKNRGMRVSTSKKMTIHFVLPKVEPMQITYNYTTPVQKEKVKTQQTYNYNIIITPPFANDTSKKN